MKFAALLFIASLGLAACGQSGTAAGPSLASASAAAHKGADQFVALASGSAQSGNAPRQTDPAAAPLLDAVLNTAPLAGATPSFDDLDAVNDWLGSANRVGEVYILAGTGVTDISTAGPSLTDHINRNTVLYAPEFGRYMDAELAIMAAEARTLAKFLADNPTATRDPTRAKGLAQTRSGLSQAVNGVLTTIPVAGLSDEWRRARASALVAAAPDLARILPADAGQQLSGVAQQVASASTDPILKGDLARFASLITKPAG